MHEVSLGATIKDYLSGEERDCTTYEDLRQALARFLVEERGFEAKRLRSHFPVAYEVDGQILEREADIAMLGQNGCVSLILLFCPGQINTYVREVRAMARLCLPEPCPLALVTDMNEADLLAVADGLVLARGLRALPDQATIEELAKAHPVARLSPVARLRESRILHTYTGFLKSCCGERCEI
ncbi:type I restriction endonuclease subunit R [Desulfovibrio sp. OttesenSCG-928-G11]|nr:type I restriction endonuclease subunit R [Desulfovibrio sp. OttesenSCG-928-G11]